MTCSVHDFDPWRFRDQTRPAPVDGDLGPAICLVDEDGPHPRAPLLRWGALVLAAFFAISTTLTAFVTAGAGSLLIPKVSPAARAAAK